MSGDRVACCRGHPITPGSTTTRRDGATVCRECKREDNLRYYARSRARMASEAPEEYDQTDEQWVAGITPGSPCDLARRLTSYRLAVEMASSLLKLGRYAEALAVLRDVEAPAR
jgi:hypothetical protein